MVRHSWNMCSAFHLPNKILFLLVSYFSVRLCFTKIMSGSVYNVYVCAWLFLCEYDAFGSSASCSVSLHTSIHMQAQNYYYYYYHRYYYYMYTVCAQKKNMSSLILAYQWLSILWCSAKFVYLLFEIYFCRLLKSIFYMFGCASF